MAKAKKSKQTGSSNRASDKKRVAKKPGQRKTPWGTTYTETRRNRSDQDRKKKL